MSDLRERLAEAHCAQHNHGLSDLTASLAGGCDDSQRWAQSALAADPALARRYERGEAWEAAEAALPEGSWLYLSRNHKGVHGAQVRGKGSPITGAGGPTATAALLALAARLREGA